MPFVAAASAEVSVVGAASESRVSVCAKYVEPLTERLVLEQCLVHSRASLLAASASGWPFVVGPSAEASVAVGSFSASSTIGTDDRCVSSLHASDA